MYRGVGIALGIGLLILWISGLAYHAPAWQTWLDGVAGVVGIAIAAAFFAARRAGMVTSGLLALGLFVLWIVGLATGGALWLAWWTFAFACAFLLLAAATGASHAPVQQLRRV